MNEPSVTSVDVDPERKRRAVIALHAFLQAEFPDSIVEFLEPSRHGFDDGAHTFRVRDGNATTIVRLASDDLDLDAQNVRDSVRDFRMLEQFAMKASSVSLRRRRR